MGIKEKQKRHSVEITWSSIPVPREIFPKFGKIYNDTILSSFSGYTCLSLSTDGFC